ncbi:MAG: YggT family protein [Sulfuritalea sp.]|nr:YggT family protein [Sulfuritalea sp.]
MSHPELLVLSTLRALVEVALWFLLGRGLLALLAGRRRHDNSVYKFFGMLTAPILKAVRQISPPQILDRHLPFAAFFLLFWLWIGLAYLRVVYCETYLLQCS